MPKDTSKDNCKSESQNNTSQNLNLGLDKFSYGDFVVLSSIIAYAIAEELNQTDLELLLAFLGMISSDIAILLIKQGIDNAKLNGAIETTVQETANESVSSQLARKSKYKKVKRVKYKVKG
ncbi:hypothetical protein [Romboutsia sp.]|uniref:hypothetical protein n=1 Tax=Romboutsia sp. TaxID=1965302 RepID=UPI003F390C7D